MAYWHRLLPLLLFTSFAAFVYRYTPNRNFAWSIIFPCFFAVIAFALVPLWRRKVTWSYLALVFVLYALGGVMLFAVSQAVRRAP
jgi:hypothetical protein